MKLYSINNSSLTEFYAADGYSRFSGSSAYKLVDGELYKPLARAGKTYEHSEGRSEINREILKEKMQRLQDFRDFDAPCGLVLQEIRQLENEIFDRKRMHLSWAWWNKIENVIPETHRRSSKRRLNKSKLKGKMFALFNLKYSRRYIAFYSISFPIGISDDAAFKAMNYWLTCLRKNYKLENYVWVTERQKNNTIHFHLLTNNFMNFKAVNDEMATIIDNLTIQGICSWGDSSKEKYNGVDGDAIFNSKRHKKTGANLNPVQVRAWISRYVTKYVTKNNSEFDHLCWHCSRSVSQLFTSEILNKDEFLEISKFLPRDKKKYFHIKSDFCNVWVFLFTPAQRILTNIIQLNNLIYSMFKEDCHSVLCVNGG